MRKLLTALATAATAALGFAEIKGTEGFEDSSYTAYDNNKPSQDAAYPFDGYGNYYRSLDDDGEVELLANDASCSCVDAVMQFFKYADAPDEFDETVKLVVFANSDGKLVVVDADATNVTTTDIAEDTWYRLTIVSVDETVNDATVKKFKVYVNGVLAKTEGGTDSFTSRVAGSNSVATMTLSGTGKVDNFVARTTDPFGGAPAGWIANIGTDDPEQYFTDYTKALKAALLAGAKLTFADGETEMDGTAAHPFEIRSAADLKALQAAVADGNGANKYYVQTADIALTEAWPGIGIQNGKDIVSTAAFDNGAFTGTYDGDNHTISNFQMVDGLDYCGFFNSVKGATIKNLKISYKDGSFAKDMAAANEACGATFVGVAKASTLQNLTSLEGTVSCTKGFGGIVGYLMAGSTVDSCTNNVNLTSTASNKAGGIAMITQSGSGTATIRNCQNNGTTAGNANQKGGIVGYVGVATTIADCEDTAGSDPSFLHHETGTLTMTGVNKAPAGVKSYTTNSTDIDGLNFATVDNGVATFVKSADLVLGSTYKVMGPNAAYAFAQAGAISFDEALATATVTAAEGLVLTTSTSGTVTTYTAAAAVAKIGDTKYTSLAAALAAAESGDTVTLAANIAVTEMQLVNKTLTLDLAGFAITAGERSAEAAAAQDDAILCVLHGGSLTINDSSADGTGAITGNSVFTTGVKMTKKGDTDDTNKATLVVNGGAITGYYYGIAGNGLAGRGNTEVTINGGTIKGTCDNDCVAIFQPQLGTLTINGGYLEGAMGVYVKSGTATVAINGGTIKGNGTYAAYVHSTNGFNNTGDAFVVDNAGYPGGAPAPSILGGTFVSVNASAIASYARTGLERIVHFADKDAVTITEAKASSEDVFLEKGFPGGLDGKTFTIDTAVQAALAEKIPEGKTLADPVEGKTSGVTYAQAYALGLLDEETGDVAKDVTSTIEIVDGKVVVSLDATAKAGYTVMLNVYEKSSLTAQWPTEPTKRYVLGSEEEFTLSEGGSGFYKVGVTIEDAASGN